MTRAPDVELRRLTWAGIEFRAGEHRVLVDPIENTDQLVHFQGRPRRPVRPVDREPSSSTYSVITHLHRDHYDAELLAELATAPANGVGCHAPIADVLASEGVPADSHRMNEVQHFGPFTVIPVPSLDWRGDDQVAWVVEAAGRKVFHCGDTIWHGSWWRIAHEHGPFDVAFFPINGVHAQLDGFTPTNVPPTLTPEQAVEAAAVLGVSVAVPMHYDLFHNPPKYTEQPNVRERFVSAARSRGVRADAPPEHGVVAFPGTNHR